MDTALYKKACGWNCPESIAATHAFRLSYVLLHQFGSFESGIELRVRAVCFILKCSKFFIFIHFGIKFSFFRGKGASRARCGLPTTFRHRKGG